MVFLCNVESHTSGARKYQRLDNLWWLQIVAETIKSSPTSKTESGASGSIEPARGKKHIQYFGMQILDAFMIFPSLLLSQMEKRDSVWFLFALFFQYFPGIVSFSLSLVMFLNDFFFILPKSNIRRL